MFLTRKDLRKVCYALNKTPLTRFYRMVRGYSSKDLIKNTMHINIPPDIFSIAFKFYKSQNTLIDVFVPFLREVITELCCTHQEEKIQIALNQIVIPVLPAEIFLCGDLEALSLVVKIAREHFSFFFAESYIYRNFEVFEQYFCQSTADVIQKRKILLENVDILAQDERFNLFRIMLKHGYPITGMFKTSKQLEDFIHYVIDYIYNKDGTVSEYPFSFMDCLLCLFDSFPELESGMDIVWMFDFATVNRRQILLRFLLERYPEIAISENTEKLMKEKGDDLHFGQITVVTLRW